MTGRPGTNHQPAAQPSKEDRGKLLARRQYVRFVFYRIDPVWRRLAADEQAAHKQELIEVIRTFNRRMLLRPYSNRTSARAETLAQKFGGTARTWLQLEEALVWADAVIWATAALHIVLYRHDMASVLRQCNKRPLVIMDITVSRDVEESVGDLAGVQVYDIDDLQSVVDSNIERRKAALPQVDTIIQQEMQRFAERSHSRQVTPVIKTLREWGQSIAEDELAQTLSRLADVDERTRQIVTRMVHRLVKRLLHEPTARLRVQAHAVRELFALNDVDAVEGQTHDVGCAFAGQTEQAASQCTLQCILPDAMRQPQP